MRAEAENFGRSVAVPQKVPGVARAARAGRRLRIGYVSGDFRLHSVAFFFAPVLENHDRVHYEITCYQCSPRSDAVTSNLRSHSDRWREAWRLNDDALETAIREDAIDILVDLSGHTAENRLPVFARRAAPVQATWLGYPGTTGVAAIDFRITDAVADPPGQSDAAHTERLYRLPRPMWSFRPDPRMPEVGPSPARTRPPTFGSFNYLPKLNDRVLELWARVLREVPASRLVVTRVPGPDSARRLSSTFAGLGVDPGRLELHGLVGRDRLANILAEVDIALDPFPYAGTTTTCEVLWMGLPVVSLAGENTPARSGASLLSAVGLSDFVADSPDAYVTTARSLALDPDALERIRGTLRARFAASPLRDEAGLARELELAYETMWKSTTLGRE
jgi:predicted O-linked N-acetylglucosamine transferase (SPINDLY family)